MGWQLKQLSDGTYLYTFRSLGIYRKRIIQESDIEHFLNVNFYHVMAAMGKPLRNHIEGYKE